MNGKGTITLGTETYMVGKVSEADMATIFAKIRKEAPGPLAVFSQLMSELKGSPVWELMTPEEQKAIERTHAAEAASKHLKKESILSDEDTIALLSMPEHCAFFAWTLIRKEHPNIGFNTIQKEITTDNADEVLAILWEESGLKKLLAMRAGYGSPEPSIMTSLPSTKT